LLPEVRHLPALRPPLTRGSRPAAQRRVPPPGVLIGRTQPSLKAPIRAALRLHHLRPGGIPASTSKFPPCFSRLAIAQVNLSGPNQLVLSAPPIAAGLYIAHLDVANENLGGFQPRGGIYPKTAGPPGGAGSLNLFTLAPLLLPSPPRPEGTPRL
jgi:hypothetical protein